jgi:hypothetical protein
MYLCESQREIRPTTIGKEIKIKKPPIVGSSNLKKGKKSYPFPNFAPSLLHPVHPFEISRITLPEKTIKKPTRPTIAPSIALTFPCSFSFPQSDTNFQREAHNKPEVEIPQIA